MWNNSLESLDFRDSLELILMLELHKPIKMVISAVEIQ